MGREYAFAVIVLVLFLPAWFASDIQLKQSYKDMKYIAGEAGSTAKAAVGWLDWIGEFARNMRNGGRISDYLFVNGYSSEGHRASYFRGIGTKSGEPEELAESAWEEISAAKRALMLAREECFFASPACTQRLYEIIWHVENGNKDAADAAQSAFSIMDSSRKALEWMGGNSIRYGGYPLAAYREAADAYEPGGRLECYRKAIAKYYSVADASSNRPPWREVAAPELGKLLPFSAIPILLEGELFAPMALVKERLPENYAVSYNLLVGAGNNRSALKEILRINKRLKTAASLMEAAYAKESKGLELAAGGLEKKQGRMEAAGASRVSYAALSKNVVLEQDYRKLIESARQSLLSAREHGESATLEYEAKGKGYLANATITKRAAIEEAKAGIASIDAAARVLDNAKEGLASKCMALSMKVEKAAGGSPSSLREIEAARQECEAARQESGYANAIGRYLGAIGELKAIGAGSAASAELARQEVDKLRAMAKAASGDLPVLEEQLMLKEAERELSACPSKSCVAGLGRAYRIAIAGQKSIMGKARQAYSQLASERKDARMLLERLAEAGDGQPLLAAKMGGIEKYYSGTVTESSLGHLSGAEALYHEIEGLKGEISPSKLLITKAEKRVVGKASCNSEAIVELNKTVYNPYGFEVGGIPPHKRVHSLSTSREKALWCGPVHKAALLMSGSYDIIHASREIRPLLPVAEAIVGFGARDALSVSGPGVRLTPSGVEASISRPSNGTASVSYRVPPSLKVIRQSCSSDGKTVACAYALELSCDKKQHVDVLFGQPAGAGGKIYTSSGNAKAMGSAGILIQNAECPGILSVEALHRDLSSASEEVLGKIHAGIIGLSSKYKKQLQGRYESLKGGSQAEIVSRGGKLLEDISKAREAQLMEEAEAKKGELAKAKLAMLKAWLSERGASPPPETGDPQADIAVLEAAKESTLASLSESYQEAANAYNGLSETGKLLEEFGARPKQLSKLSDAMAKASSSNGYLSFSRHEGEINRLISRGNAEAKRLAKGISLAAIPAELPLKAALELAAKGNGTLVSREYVRGLLSSYGKLAKLQKKAATRYDGTIESLKEIEGMGALPDKIRDAAAALESNATEKLASARQAAEKEIAMGGSAHYLALANKSLAAGRISEAYDYAKAAKGEGGTGLAPLAKAPLLAVPLLLAAVIWQFRKGKKVETPMQRAIRISS